MTTKNKKSALLILDGWGLSPDPKVSAIDHANLPYYDSLINTYSNAEILTDGLNVGLPKGQMGNSEVGHMNIGAGRIVYQDLVKINKSIEDGSFENLELLVDAFANAKANNRSVHLLGLVSDGGVHSHLDHLKALIKMAKDSSNDHVYIHAITDGRDTDPKGAINYLNDIISETKDSKIKIATAIGRYYAMDRDKRWERIRKSYDLMVHGKGELTSDLLSDIKKSYDEGITDEFLEPILCCTEKEALIKDGDTVIFYNYRGDRPREITTVLSQSAIKEEKMTPMKLNFISFTEYDSNYKNVDVLFRKDKLTNTIGEQVSKMGRTQLRVAETEKYAHVTFFFSGGREEVYEGEDRLLVPSPKVATYDLQPEMSAYKITEQVIEYIEDKQPDFIVLNYANTDMIGHTGVFSAAIKAAETVDNCLSQLVPTLIKNGYETIIIADHGNSDNMINPDGSVNTQHSLNPVPIIYVPPIENDVKVQSGILADIAPTLLHLMDLPIPTEMGGKILV